MGKLLFDEKKELTKPVNGLGIFTIHYILSVDEASNHKFVKENPLEQSNFEVKAT